MGMPTNVRPRRQARENRINDWLSPLDAQAEMDRQQGTDVTPSWTSGSKSGGALASTVGAVTGGTSGGGGASTGGGASIVPASSQSNCASGKCGVSRPATTTAAPPMPTLPANPTPEQRTAYADALKRYAIAVGRDQPTVGNLSQQESREQRQQVDIERESARRDRLDAENSKRADAMQKVIEITEEANAEKALSEGRLNDATTALTLEGTGVGSAKAARTLLTTAIEEGMTPQDYAAARERIESGTINLPNTPRDEPEAGKPSIGQAQQTVAPAVSEDRRNVYLRQGFAAHGVNMLITSEEFAEQMTMTPAQEMAASKKKPKPAEGAVGKDPATGKPVETKEKPKAKGPEAEFAERIDRSAKAIVDGFESTGLFKSGDKSKIEAAIESEVGNPLRDFSRRKMLELHKAEIDRLPEEYRDAAIQAYYGRADRQTDRVLDVIRADSFARAGALGGAWSNPAAIEAAKEADANRNQFKTGASRYR